jgi:hypothetical protein
MCISTRVTYTATSTSGRRSDGERWQRHPRLSALQRPGPLPDCAILPKTDRSAGVQPVASGHVRAPGAGRTEPGLTALAVAGAIALSALGSVLSYTALTSCPVSVSEHAGLGVRTPWMS